jgi:hypothetical protein
MFTARRLRAKCDRHFRTKFLAADTMNQLNWLQSWYVEQCDGDWEDTYGISIETLDNPGWSLDIDLAETPLENVEQARHFDERSENNWISYEIREGRFIGRGGPANLEELIGIFRQFWQKGASTVG